MDTIDSNIMNFDGLEEGLAKLFGATQSEDTCIKLVIPGHKEPMPSIPEEPSEVSHPSVPPVLKPSSVLVSIPKPPPVPPRKSSKCIIL